MANQENMVSALRGFRSFLATALIGYGTYLFHSSAVALVLFGKFQADSAVVALIFFASGRALLVHAQRLVVLRSFQSMASESFITKTICGQLSFRYLVILLANRNYTDFERRYTPGAMFGMFSGIVAVLIFDMDFMTPLSMGEAVIVAGVSLFTTDRWYWWRFRPTARRSPTIGFDLLDIGRLPISELTKREERKIQILRHELRGDKPLRQIFSSKFVPLLPVSRIEIICHENYWIQVALYCISICDLVVFDLTGLADSEGLQKELEFALALERSQHLRGRLKFFCRASDMGSIDFAEKIFRLDPGRVAVVGENADLLVNLFSS